MEGKRFSADVKCEDPVRVQVESPNICVSIVPPYGVEKKKKRVLILFVLTEIRQIMWMRFVYLSKKRAG
jgi:hypothetical protein